MIEHLVEAHGIEHRSAHPETGKEDRPNKKESPDPTCEQHPQDTWNPKVLPSPHNATRHNGGQNNRQDA